MLTFRCKTFNELNVLQLYAIMALRQEVFVVEQNCPYLDADGKDLAAHHLVGYDDEGNTVAYARLLPKGVSYEHHVSLGRIVTKPSQRRKGWGKELMENALNWAENLYPNKSIKISAQTYLRKFYEDFGFIVSGEEYLEDDIPHLPMVRG